MTPHNQPVHFLCQALQNGELGAYLGARHNRHQRPGRVLQGTAYGIELCGEQGAGARHRRILGHPHGGGLGAMRGPKCIVHKDIAQTSDALRQGRVVFLFARVKATVFQQHHFTGCSGYAIKPIRLQLYRLTQDVAQARGDRCQGVLGLGLAFGGTAQMGGHQNRAGPGLQGHANRWHTGAHPRVFGNGTMRIQRHIQISPNQYPPPLDLTLVTQVLKSNPCHDVYCVSDAMGTIVGLSV